MRYAHFIRVPVRQARPVGPGPDMLLLTASELGCIRGSRHIFTNINWQLAAGEALALVGPNGSGKSSLLRLVAGLLQPSVGRIELAGGTPERTIAEQAHYLGHLDALKPSLTASENLHFWASYLGGGTQAPALAAVGLGGLADLPAAYLSAGQRRRLSIARLIAIKRPIWLLDGPTSALDAAAQAYLAGCMGQHLAGGGLIVAAAHGPIGLAAAKELRLGGAP